MAIKFVPQVTNLTQWNVLNFNMKKKIPVYIITGFLGSGKTTFLNHFLKSKKKILVNKS